MPSKTANETEKCKLKHKPFCCSKSTYLIRGLLLFVDQRCWCSTWWGGKRTSWWSRSVSLRSGGAGWAKMVFQTLSKLYFCFYIKKLYLKAPMPRINFTLGSCLQQYYAQGERGGSGTYVGASLNMIIWTMAIAHPHRCIPTNRKTNSPDIIASPWGNLVLKKFAKCAVCQRKGPSFQGIQRINRVWESNGTSRRDEPAILTVSRNLFESDVDNWMAPKDINSPRTDPSISSGRRFCIDDLKVSGGRCHVKIGIRNTVN